MTIYKQVMSQPTLDNSDAKENKDALSVDDSDESFEYFSDKEEAAKHRSSEAQKQQKKAKS